MPVAKGRKGVKQEKTCTMCKAVKPIGEFHKASHPGSYASRCKSCALNRFNAWRKANPQDYAYFSWRSTLKKKYGLTEARFKEISESQNHGCAICGEINNVKRRRLAIDHDHQTNAIRGLLCNSCNRGLGYFRDRADLLSRAAEYLTVTRDLRRAS